MTQYSQPNTSFLSGIFSSPWSPFSWRASGHDDSDAAYAMSLSPDGRSLACVHVSGAVSVHTVPGLKEVVRVAIEEQACYDDLSPQVLQMPAKQRKKFLGRWHPTGIAWWDDSKVAVARASGGVTILDSAGDFAHNVLGPSAEFFASGIKMAKNKRRPSTEHNGFFLLEVAAPVKEGINDESVLSEEEEDEDDEEGDDEAGIISRVVSMLTWWRGRKQKQSGPFSWTQELRLLYFQGSNSTKKN